MGTIVVTVMAVEASSTTFCRHHRLQPLARNANLVVNAPRATGGFGAVHTIVSVGGKQPPRPLVLKVYADEALANVGGADRIVDNHRQLMVALDDADEPSWPDALLAFPFALVRAEVDGRSTLGAVMLDLGAMGYEGWAFDPADVAPHLQRDVRDRVELALRLAERHALLERISFVHGDLNLENVMVHSSTLDVQIIDFDGGVLVRRGDERPLTAGKADEFMPPEMKKATGLDLAMHTLTAERWSVGSLVGCFLFAVHPGFFLRAISRKVIEAYAKHDGPWPAVDRTGALFTEVPANHVAYDVLCAELSSIPEGARELFAQLFAAGLRADRRPSSKDWVEALADLRRPPVIVSLRVEPDMLLEGDLVTVTWETRNAWHVEVAGLNRLPAAGSVRVAVDRTCSYRLIAHNAYGTDEADTDVVRVVPIPGIDHIPVPEFPSLSLDTRLPVVTSARVSLPGRPTVERVNPPPWLTTSRVLKDVPPPVRHSIPLTYPAAPPALPTRLPMSLVTAIGRHRRNRRKAT